jgi:hypothetical protein
MHQVSPRHSSTPVTPHGSTLTPRRSPALAAALLVLAALGLSGCAAAALAGMMAQSAQETGTRTVEAEYTGLVGKSYAVVVSADRSIEASYPGVVAMLTQKINERLRDSAGATGWIATEDLLGYLYNNPRWVARPRSELAAELGVDRLIVVDLQEFHLYDPGNQYLWDGVAQGRVAVVEADSPVPDSYAYDTMVTVRFPDKSGSGPLEMPQALVSSSLILRFAVRASWTFYKHDEPYIRNPNY